MGYVCPVCEDPQADGEHLANHLAFTAMLGDEAHETWLDDRAPDWAALDPPALAQRVVDYAEERDFPQVFEDTTNGDGGREHGQEHSHEHEHGHRDGDAGIADGVPGGVDADVPAANSVPDDVLAEARELTRKRRGTDEESAADTAERESDTDTADE